MERFSFIGDTVMEAQKRAEYLRKKAAKVLIEICVVGLFLAVGALTAVLFCFGIRPYVVVTGSMEPTIHLGSICFVDMAYAYNDVKKGDIISYKNGDVLVTHRVEQVTQNGLATRGDNAQKNDTGFVTEYDFCGKVVFWIPFLGYAALFIRTKAGFFTVLAVICGFAIWDDFKSKKR